MPSFCAIVGCGNRGQRDDKSFYRIPAVIQNQDKDTEEISKRRRDLWLTRISRADLRESSLPYARICSDHFISGRPAALRSTTNPDWAPSVKLGHDKNTTSLCAADRHQRKRLRTERIGTDEGIPIENMAHDIKSEAVFIKEEEIFIKEEPTESMETGSACDEGNGVKFGDEDRIIKDEIDFNNDESQHLNIFNDPILLPINEKESESPTPAAASHSDKRDDFDRAAAPISSTSTGGTTGPKLNDVKSRLPPSKRSKSNRGGVEPNDVLAAVMEQLKSMSSQEKTNDEATDFGVVVANSLRQMTNKNKIYSQKLIHDIICLGRLDRLSASTKIVE